MSPPITPWSQAIRNHLADGRWYHVDEVLAIGAAAVPPGRAIQQRERLVARKRTSTALGRPVTDDDRIRIGARAVARDALHGLTRRGHIEARGHMVRSTR